MFKYTGRGFVPGIPARDLTDEEVESIGKKRIKATGLYKEVKSHPRAVSVTGPKKSGETLSESGAYSPEEAQ